MSEADKTIQVFRYIAELDALVVTPEYRDIARVLDIDEWAYVNWMGRLFALDNDFGEHWFDNWVDRERIATRVKELGLDDEELLFIAPGRMKDGADGPCHSDETRRRFWRDVLVSLRVSVGTLCGVAMDQAASEPEAARERIARALAIARAWT